MKVFSGFKSLCTNFASTISFMPLKIKFQKLKNIQHNNSGLIFRKGFPFPFIHHFPQISSIAIRANQINVRWRILNNIEGDDRILALQGFQGLFLAFEQIQQNLLGLDFLHVHQFYRHGFITLLFFCNVDSFEHFAETTLSQKVLVVPIVVFYFVCVTGFHFN
jgi:hypothetical protein